jgi:hypothetical protein
LSTTPDKTIQLCGLSPKEIISIAGRAIDFWNYQFQTSLEYEKAELKHSHMNVAHIEKAYSEKLEEAHNKISMLRKQLEVMRKETENDKKEIGELQEKYSDKARQKRKLEELYEALKHKLEVGYPSQRHPSYLTLGFQTNKPKPMILTGTNCELPQRSNSARSPLMRQTPTDIDRFTYAKRRECTSVHDSPVTAVATSEQLLSPASKPVFRVLKMPESPRFSQLTHNSR